MGEGPYYNGPARPDLETSLYTLAPLQFMAKGKGLKDLRLQKYKQNRLAGMNRYNAAIAAGYSESYALKCAKKIEAQVATDLKDVFERKGLTDKALVEFALEALQAVKLQSCDIYVKTEDGKTVINKNSNDFIEVPDWHARHKFFQTIMELTGRIKIKVDHTGKIDGPEQRIVIVYPPDYKAKSERLNGITSKDISG